MKQTLPWLLVAGCAGVAAGFLLRGQQQAVPPSPEDAKAQLIQTAMKPAAGEKIVHTFADQAAMQAFVDFWQQRQQRVLRMAMLEGYWNNEQATLEDLNSQVTSQYSLDLSKHYSLNSDERVLIERESPAATETEAVTPAEAATPAEGPGGERKVVHTFADDGAMQAFAQLWQQRQSVLVRMAVLKAYWESEQQLVAQLNKTLAADYEVDVTKSYTLDNQRRVLIEREAPQAPLPAAPSAQRTGATQAGPQAAAPSPQPPAQAQVGTSKASN